MEVVIDPLGGVMQSQNGLCIVGDTPRPVKVIGETAQLGEISAAKRTVIALRGFREEVLESPAGLRFGAWAVADRAACAISI